MAMQFAQVKMVGQIPWSGVALAELGDAANEPDVTVDTQLVAEGAPPVAFVAVGSQRDVELSAYALVQLPENAEADVEATITGARPPGGLGTSGDDRAALASAQLRASLLDAQVEELRAQRNEDAVAHAEAIASVEAELAERLSQLQHVERRIAEANVRAEQGFADARAKDEEIARLRDRGALVLRELEDERRARTRAEQELGHVRASLESAARDRAALPVAAERVRSLEDAIERLVAGTEEQAERLSVAEDARSKLEIALATALVELDGVRRSRVDVEQQAGLAGSAAQRVRELQAAVEALRAEAATAADVQGQELSALESALRERGRAVEVLEHELARRERIILDLVHAFEEARTVGATGSVGDAAHADALREARREVERARAESNELRQKLDAAALEIARREGQSATTAWRIQELEETIARLDAEQSELTMTIPPPAFLSVEREANDVTVLTDRLSTALDELEIVRQALAQEHQARVQAESGEALAQAREDLARQAALLEKLSGELDAADRTRRAAADDASAQR
jgi:chromosome segregation ATPase